MGNGALAATRYLQWNATEVFDSLRPPMVSTGMGRTTCSYFMPDNKHILYASTHLADAECPEVPLRKNGKYVWPVYDSLRHFCGRFGRYHRKTIDP